MATIRRAIVDDADVIAAVHVEGRLQGRRDSPLTIKGLEQVQSFGVLLRAELLGAKAVCVCTSPLPSASAAVGESLAVRHPERRDPG